MKSCLSSHSSNTSNNLTGVGVYSSTGGHSFLKHKNMENVLSQKASTIIKQNVPVPGKFVKNPSLKLLVDHTGDHKTKIMYRSPQISLPPTSSDSNTFNADASSNIKKAPSILSSRRSTEKKIKSKKGGTSS